MPPSSRGARARRLLKCTVVIAGIILGQAILYGPSLLGRKVLLPLDVLALPGVYLPTAAATPPVGPQNPAQMDLIFLCEPARTFLHHEISHGRFPLWAPYHYGGVPFVWPKYSPFLLLAGCFRSPVILAWTQLFAAVVAGLGMYAFCRRSLRVGFWPAAVCAWCYPLTAFFVLWQGLPTGLAVCWLPWVFLAVERTVAGAPAAGAGLGAATFLALVSGHLDVAGQVLLASAAYALWCRLRPGGLRKTARESLGIAARLFLGWSLGFLLAAPHILPLLEYASTGSRMTHRASGAEERPPVGLASLPQTVLPDMYGTQEKGSAFIAPAREPNLPESASAAYAGILATLVAAPLGWWRRSRRAESSFWAFLAFIGLSWSLHVPAITAVMRLPILTMMSHNRLVFITSFSVLCLGAIGLENLRTGDQRRRWWFCVPTLILAGLFAWCIYRCFVLPPPIASSRAFDEFLSAHPERVQPGLELARIQGWFVRHSAAAALLCALGLAAWAALWFGGRARSRLFAVLAALLAADLLWFDYGRSVQSDPALYYPAIPALEAIKGTTPGRVVGSLPASLGIMAGLDQISGYDGIDPARMVDLLKVAAAPESPVLPYAQVQLFVPQVRFSSPSMVQLPPVLDMLDVRYVILRGGPVPSLRPIFEGDGYMVMLNPNARPRVYVPRFVATVSNPGVELKTLASPQFDPRRVALVESPISLASPCRGEATLVLETPAHVSIETRMETPGLVVLADNWDKGWHAFFNGRAVPILRTNYALRGVVVPAGAGRLEFAYRPASVVIGFWLAGLGGLILIAIIAARRPLPGARGFRFALPGAGP